MLRTERVMIYGLLGASLLAVAGQGFGARFGLAQASPAAAAPDMAKIATCDIYQLVERMVEGSSYLLARNAEQERIRTVLRPMEVELDKMQVDIRAGSPEDPVTAQKMRAFEAKRKEYGEKTEAESRTYAKVVTGHFTDAYGKVAAEAKKIADSLGYTHVLAQKRGDLVASNPQQLIEEFLSRPLTVSPDATDITEQVRTAMKLPTAPSPANPPTKAPEPKK